MAFLVIAGILLMTLGTVVLVLRLIARRTPASDQDYVVVCGALLGLMIGFILLAYALPKL